MLDLLISAKTKIVRFISLQSKSKRHHLHLYYETQMNKYILLICLATSLAISCKKENPKPDDNLDEAGFVKVLKENSGFTQVYNATGAGINLTDFTVEANDNLNIYHYTVTMTQQGSFESSIRKSKNLKTGEDVPLPQYASTNSGAVVDQQKLTHVIFEAFRPYSNFLASGTYLNGNTTYNFKVNFGGDISGEVKIANPLGMPALGYYYPSLDALNTGQAYFGVGVPTPNHLFKVVNFYEGAFSNGSDKNLVKIILESRVPSNNNGTAMRFVVNKTSVYAYEANVSDPQVNNKKGEILFSNPLTNAEITRHYSSDGKILVLLINDTKDNKYWAISYNFSTSTLTKLFDKVALDYGAEGSDVDCDEAGNLYYTGIASKGQNNSGVSIYKKDIAGNTTVVGTDDFLKFGQIIKLKSLHGKIYLALRGKITGSSDSQLSILKQD